MMMHSISNIVMVGLTIIATLAKTPGKPWEEPSISACCSVLPISLSQSHP